ncbi:MAG: RNA polymerase sigma factor [bacterium]
MISDWDNLERARQGDETAWRGLIAQHDQSLLRTTFLVTGSLAAAKDLVQEAFLRLLHCQPKHQHGSFKAYLSTIAFRLALKEKARRQRHTDIDTVELADQTVSPLESVLCKERDRQLATVITALPDHHRLVLVLRFYGEHSYEEIARILDLPLGTVKSRLFNAVKACRHGMREKGIVP